MDRPPIHQHTVRQPSDALDGLARSRRRATHHGGRFGAAALLVIVRFYFRAGRPATVVSAPVPGYVVLRTHLPLRVLQLLHLAGIRISVSVPDLETFPRTC